MRYLIVTGVQTCALPIFPLVHEYDGNRAPGGCGGDGRVHDADARWLIARDDRRRPGGAAIRRFDHEYARHARTGESDIGDEDLARLAGDRGRREKSPVAQLGVVPTVDERD